MPRARRRLPWAALAVYAAAALAPMRALDALPVVCPFRRLTGLPCPGCGGTHAFVAMAHGDFAAAWAYNPLGAAAFAAGIVWLLLVFTGRAPRISAAAGARIAAACLGGALAFGAWRIFHLLNTAGR